jgi:hypothetical protein
MRPTAATSAAHAATSASSSAAYFHDLLLGVDTGASLCVCCGTVCGGVVDGFVYNMGGGLCKSS